MNKITQEMLKIYKPISHLDWMNYHLVRKDVTFHHLQKHENGGKRTIENGALLMPLSHQYLHLIECKEIELYKILNRLFKIVNEQKYEPTREQRQLVESLLREFEELHRWDKNSKGKLVLQRKYLKRGFYDE